MNLSLTPRELATAAVIGGVACMIFGAILAALFVALVTLPNRDAEALARVESAYAKGAMVQIARRKANCREYVLRDSKAVCV